MSMMNPLFTVLLLQSLIIANVVTVVAAQANSVCSKSILGFVSSPSCDRTCHSIIGSTSYDRSRIQGDLRPRSYLRPSPLVWNMPLKKQQPSLSSSLLLSSQTQQQQQHGFGEMTVSELKSNCKERGLVVSGRKAELTKRLEDYELNMNVGYDVSNDETTNGESGLEEENLKEMNENGVELSNVSAASTLEEEESINGKIMSELPKKLLSTVLSRLGNPSNANDDTNSNEKIGTVTLLPIQKRAFYPLYNEKDCILHSPTGSGKTLAYVLPLTARLFQQRLSQPKPKFSNSGKNNNVPPCCKPSILCILPSRELARQVGKVWSQHCNRIATVYGGVPLERHSSLLTKKRILPEIVIGTPGRIRELIREKHLSTDGIKVVVLDEADVLLNYKDFPETELLLESLTTDYQLVLVSATVSPKGRVRRFASETMDWEEEDEGYIEAMSVQQSQSSMASVNNNGVEVDSSTTTANTRGAASAPPIRHYSTAVTASARSAVTSDLITTLSPRLTIVFCNTKADTEMIAADLSNSLGGGEADVRALHGDMVQAARSRVIAALRKDLGVNKQQQQRVLVATDVASRGLDLPSVDLVVQMGIPKKNGKDGTYDIELYTHRTGRAGRVGFDDGEDANAVLLYDPREGEAKILPKLVQDLQELDGNMMLEKRPVPSALGVMEASYERSVRRVDSIANCNDDDGDAKQEQLVAFFKSNLLQSEDFVGNANVDETLLHRLSCAMAALSGLDGAPPERSLLTADARDRTIRVFKRHSLHNDDDDDDDATLELVPVTPPEVTKLVKGLGSGKLGRMTICQDGSAVFDLPSKRAIRLFNAAEEAKTNGELEEDAWCIELPSTLSF